MPPTKELTLREYHVKVTEAIIANKDWRAGQAMFNVLCELRPDLSEQIRGTNLDPFYVGNADIFDGRIRDVSTWIAAHWADDPETPGDEGSATL